MQNRIVKIVLENGNSINYKEQNIEHFRKTGQSESWVKNQFFIPNTEELGQLENLEDKFSLTMKYKTADDWARIIDQDVRCFYMGTKEIPNDKDELVTCGVFVTKEECFIAGGKTLVDAVRQLPTKSPISITYRGKKANKTVDGSTMIFDVKTLG